MTASLDSPEVAYIQKFFFEILDSIRYAKDKYNPSYRHLEPGVKAKTTNQLQKIAERAAHHFWTEYSANKAKIGDDDLAIKALQKESLEHGLNSVERGE